MSKEYTVVIPIEKIREIKEAQNKLNKAHAERLDYSKANPAPSEDLRNLCRDEDWAIDNLDSLKYEFANFILEQIEE